MPWLPSAPGALDSSTFDEFFENMRQVIRWDAGPVVGDVQRDAARHDTGAQQNACFRRCVHDRIGNHIADGLFGQSGICPHQRKIGRQIDLDVLPRAMPPRRADHAFGHFPQVDPVAAQFQCAGINAGDRQKIAHHFVEVFGFLLDLTEQIFFRRRIELVAIVDQAGGRTEDR